MRILAAAILIAMLPTAADARDASPPRRGISRAQAVAALQNPLVQDGIAQAITQFAGIVLDTRVGALGGLADQRIGPDDTLRDIAHRDDPRFEDHLHDRTRHALAAAGALAGGADAEAAEIDRTARRLETALAPLLAYAGSDRRR